MTRRQFRRIAAVRLPFPDEVICFAESQGWTLHQSCGFVYLCGAGARSDPAALRLDVLLREPSYAVRVAEALEQRAELYAQAGWSLSTEGERW